MPTNDKLDPETRKRIRRDRREEILQAASVLFGNYGFQNTPLSLIAQSVGLSEPGVLHYFPSKVHLLQGVLDYQEQLGAVRYARLFGPEENVLAGFLEALQDSLVENQKDPTLARFFTVLVGESIQKEHPGHDILAHRYERIQQLIVTELECRHNIEIAANFNVSQLTSLILAVFEGLQIQSLLTPEKADNAATFQLFSQMFLDYVQKVTREEKRGKPALED
ncbi:MAG: TetR/AcrR family transcriptional regulator [Chloroflexi bacterium]|nr:TetR/AcrR family transcriptional regulator [Chloroflexota bacterium]